MFAIYIKRAAEAFGITHTREIYEKAIEVLPNDGARYVVGVMYSAGDLLPIQPATVTVAPSPPLSNPLKPHVQRNVSPLCST